MCCRCCILRGALLYAGPAAGTKAGEEHTLDYFGHFYLDKEKDILVDLYTDGGEMHYVLRTPNHGTGNLIRNLADLCGLPLSVDEEGLLVIRGTVPSYFDAYGRTIRIFRLGGTKTANIFEDGTIEMKAQIPAISKTLMSQTKEYRLDVARTIVKTYIFTDCKFRTDLHTHMNANLHPDLLIALGIVHQIRYPLYYIRKLGLRVTEPQRELLARRREAAEARYRDSGLTGKYLARRIDDNTFLNFADLLLQGPEDAADNIAKIRRSLAVRKDGQAVFTNLEKVYLYRYVFTKGQPAEDPVPVRDLADRIPDAEIREAVRQMLADRDSGRYKDNTLFQDKLLWIARSYRRLGITYAEITDTTLVKPQGAAQMLEQVHAVMPRITEETGVTLRFLAGIRRIPLTIVKDNIAAGDYFRENLLVLREIADDPYVAGCDIIGEEINDILDLRGVVREIVRIAQKHPDFVVRIHAGENDSLRDNVANSVRCVREAVGDGGRMPRMRIGHGLYTADLRSTAGKALLRDLREEDITVEFQITSNVRLNNLSDLSEHPLKQYLRAGVRCVQGTDGGALYGTDSVDEQLTLEKMLDLTHDEMCSMRAAEERVRQQGMQALRDKEEQLLRTAGDAGGTQQYWQARIDAAIRKEQERAPGAEDTIRLPIMRKVRAQDALADRICEYPEEKTPIVIAGGSFNSDRHTTRLREDDLESLRALVAEADPDRYYFVIGHRLRGYEARLLEMAGDRFAVYAIVPAWITPREVRRLRESGVRIRVSIEPEPMGVYKSFAYEIFKRRPSVFVAFDGNSAGANMIQEARNARYRCRICVSAHSRILLRKAQTLEGYVTVLRGGGRVPLL